MDRLSFIFTVFFMLPGPIKLIPASSGAWRSRAAVIGSALRAFVAPAGGMLLGRYRISIDALRIAGGLVLLISALPGIFKKAQPPDPPAGTPAGVDAILIFMMPAPQYPGMAQTVAVCLAIIMVLDFLAMYFIDRVLKTPGLEVIKA